MSIVECNPRLLGLPHAEWRPGQQHAYQTAVEKLTSGGGYLVLDAPVGTGKSAIPTALGAHHYVTVLVHNHGLLHQYRDVYGFEIIKGKAEYRCIHSDKTEYWRKHFDLVPTAADCHYLDPTDCEYYIDCPYQVARSMALRSKRCAVTYKYATLSEAIHERDGVLVMDEAHMVYDELLEFAQFQMDETTRRTYKFAAFPLRGYGENGEGDLLTDQAHTVLVNWIMDCITKVAEVDLFNQMTPLGAKQRKIYEQLKKALEMLSCDQPLFYFCNLPAELNDWRFEGVKERHPILQLRSLDVKDIVREIIGKKKLTVMMSATIGNPAALMSEMGIAEYEAYSYDHPVPVANRPIYDLGIAKMTKANLDSNPALYRLQADRIAEFIQSLDPHWRGIVVTSSNYKVNLLRNALRKHLNGRVLLPGEMTSLQQLEAFIAHPRAGEVLVGAIQRLGTGISLDGDLARFSIVAGVPFSNPGNRFDQLRMSTETGKKYSFWSAYNAVMQATGRVTRGEMDAMGYYQTNVAALADGSCTTPLARHNYNCWFKSAITPWK